MLTGPRSERRLVNISWIFQAPADSRFRGRYYGQREGRFAKSEAVLTFSDYGESGVVADLFRLPEVAANDAIVL